MRRTHCVGAMRHSRHPRAEKSSPWVRRYRYYERKTRIELANVQLHLGELSVTTCPITHRLDGRTFPREMCKTSLLRLELVSYGGGDMQLPASARELNHCEQQSHPKQSRRATRSAMISLRKPEKYNNSHNQTFLSSRHHLVFIEMPVCGRIRCGGKQHQCPLESDK